MNTTITSEQIEGLRSEAADAGDLVQVAVCDIALRGRATGRPAVEYATAGLADLELSPNEVDDDDGVIDVDDDRIEQILAEDPSLLYVVGDRAAATAECARVIAEAEAARS